MLPVRKLVEIPLCRLLLKTPRNTGARVRFRRPRRFSLSLSSILKDLTARSHGRDALALVIPRKERLQRAARARLLPTSPRSSPWCAEKNCGPLRRLARRCVTRHLNERPFNACSWPEHGVSRTRARELECGLRSCSWLIELLLPWLPC